MLYRCCLHEAHRIHSLDDPFRQGWCQGTERAVYLRLGCHVCVCYLVVSPWCFESREVRAGSLSISKSLIVGLHRHLRHMVHGSASKSSSVNVWRCIPRKLVCRHILGKMQSVHTYPPVTCYLTVTNKISSPRQRSSYADDRRIRETGT
jgi:hypothetical protein